MRSPDLSSLSENAQLVIGLVQTNPGNLSKSSLVELFDQYQQKSVRKTLGQLLRTDKWLVEKNGLLYLGSSFPTQNDLVVKKDIRPQQTDAFPSLPWAHEEAIEIPEAISQRSIEIIFELQIRIREALRIGLAPQTQKHSIVWLPPGSDVLRVKLGEYSVSSQMEMMRANYLALVTKQGRGYVVRYYAPPHGETFALMWANE